MAAVPLGEQVLAGLDAPGGPPEEVAEPPDEKGYKERQWKPQRYSVAEAPELASLDVRPRNRFIDEPDDEAAACPYDEEGRAAQ